MGSFNLSRRALMICVAAASLVAAYCGTEEQV